MILRKVSRLAVAAMALVCAVATSSCNKQSNDLENDNLKGKVKTLTERNYMAIQEFDSVSKGDPYILDRDGWDTRRCYNEKGYMTEFVQLAIGGDDTITITSMVYDTIYPTQRALEITADEKGEPMRFKAITYNTAGKPDTVTITDAYGRMKQRVITKYARGMQEQYYYDSEGRLGLKELTVMDDDYPMQVESYDKEGALQRKCYNFWKKGLRDSTLFIDNEGNIMVQVGFEYDKNGNITKQYGVDENGDALKVETYEYKYDEKGNWVSRIYRVDNKPFSVVERTIEYYN